MALARREADFGYIQPHLRPVSTADFLPALSREENLRLFRQAEPFIQAKRWAKSEVMARTGRKQNSKNFDLEAMTVRYLWKHVKIAEEGEAADRTWADQVKEGREHYNELEERNFGLVGNYIVRKLRTCSGDIDKDELRNTGRDGLRRGIEGWDPRRGELSTYATYWIAERVGGYLEQVTRVLKIPEGIIDAKRRLDQLISEEGSMSDEELTERAGISSSILQKTRRAEEVEGSVVYLYALTGDGDKTFEDYITGIEPPAENGAMANFAKQAFFQTLDNLPKPLTQSQRMVLSLATGLEDQNERVLTEIGQELGCAPQNAQQILKRARKKLLLPKNKAFIRQELQDYYDLN